MKAIKTNMRTADGLTVYDLAPLAADLYAVAGPAGYDPVELAAMVADDQLPAGIRWIKDEEWSDLGSPTTSAGVTPPSLREPSASPRGPG